MRDQKILSKYIKFTNGFTLVEMAIVLVIFGLILAMFLSPLATQRELRNRGQTLERLSEAKEALMGFTLASGFLPCPDTDPVPDGNENRINNNCDQNEGILPWKNLGIEATDAWNHYFTYRVDSTFSSSDPSKRFTISNADDGSIVIYAEDPNTSIISTGTHLAAVIISHGANGRGATNTNNSSSTNKQPTPTGSDEIENTDQDVNFVSHPPTSQGSGAGEFDDMLTWISPKVLINRMIMAERLP